MEREQAMNAAIKEAYLRQHGALRGGKQYSIDEQYQLLFQRGAEYAAGQQQWVDVDDRLPTESGPHIFKQIGDDDMYDCLYLGLNTISDKAEYLKSHYVAWMPIPEYQRPSAVGGDKNDERNR